MNKINHPAEGKDNMCLESWEKNDVNHLCSRDKQHSGRCMCQCGEQTEWFRPYFGWQPDVT